MDQIDIYDKEIGDTYDYYDDATSFNFGADTTLKEQFLALRKGDHVMGIAIERNKKQRIPLQPAGKYIGTQLDAADSCWYSSLGHSLEIVSVKGLPT